MDSRQHLERDAPERPHVGSRVRVVAFELLRRPVLERHDICGFQIAVNDAAAVCLIERLVDPDRPSGNPRGERLVLEAAAVPKTFAMTNDDVRYVAEFIDSLFPMRREGYNFDLYVSNADVNAYNLEAIRVPTLIVHTRDDQLASHDASKRAAERIPGARFISLESGGQLMLGHTKYGDELAAFFDEEERSSPKAGGIASAGFRRIPCFPQPL